MSGNLIDDYDVGLFLDRLDMLRSKYNLAIILIHHSRIAEHNEGETYHYGTDEIFGSSRFPRWMDTIIHITKVSDSSSTGIVNLKLTFEKTRHSEFKIPEMLVNINRNNLTFIKEKNAI
jgi:RecA-family ATPase